MVVVVLVVRVVLRQAQQLLAVMVVSAFNLRSRVLITAAVVAVRLALLAWVVLAAAVMAEEPHKAQRMDRQTLVAAVVATAGQITVDPVVLALLFYALKMLISLLLQA